MNIIKKIIKSFEEKRKKPLFKLINSSWHENGASDELLLFLNLICNNSRALKVFHKNIWLIYICCLLEKGEKNNANSVLNRYLHIYGTENIELYLPVANLAFEKGICNDDISISARIFNIFEKSRKNNLFMNYIRGKSIAIVGNGPQELNRKKGKEIDAHDVVIRFNYYKQQGFEEDYGTKTDIWVKNHEIQATKISNDVDFVVLKLDYWHSAVNLDRLKLNLKNVNNVDCIQMQHKKISRLYMEDILHDPTLGFYVITSIFKEFGNFNNIDFYGFSFLEEGFRPCAHFYENRSEKEYETIQKFHKFKEETEILKKLVSTYTL